MLIYFIYTTFNLQSISCHTGVRIHDFHKYKRILCDHSQILAKKKFCGSHHFEYENAGKLLLHAKQEC